MSSVIGIDLGSCTTKIVRLLDGEISHTEVFPTEHDPLARVRAALSPLGSAQIVATGYGRHLLSENVGAKRVTEIKACARGAHHLFPDCRTILDVGGQDCKVIYLNGHGRVVDFEMNDRCAAGTGKFLEVMAQKFNLDIESFVRMALQASKYVTINSMCTVFAESEVISLMTTGKPRDEIALGLHVSIAHRLNAMLTRISSGEDILFVGGGAKNDCLCQLLERQTKRKFKRPENPQIVSALGAALLAEELVDSAI